MLLTLAVSSVMGTAQRYSRLTAPGGKGAVREFTELVAAAAAPTAEERAT